MARLTGRRERRGTVIGARRGVVLRLVARGAVARDAHHAVPLAEDVAPRVGGAEDQHGGAPQGTGAVHEAGIAPDDHVAAGQQGEGLGPAGGEEQGVHLAEVEAEGVEVVLLVVDDQDRVVPGVLDHAVRSMPLEPRWVPWPDGACPQVATVCAYM